MSVNGLAVDYASTIVRRPHVNIILAQDAGYGVGYKGRLPWENEPYKNDMRMFRELTAGETGSKNAVVMGYNTWESIPARSRPLRMRTNIVLTNRHRSEMAAAAGSADSVLVFGDWSELQEHLLTTTYDCVWVIGGVDVYRGAISHLDVRNVYQTIFNKVFKCDKYINIEGLLAGEGLTWTKEVLRDDDDGRVYVISVIDRKEDCQ